MKHPWLTLLTFGFTGIIVLFFFHLHASPLEIPSPEQENLPDITEPSVTYVNPTKGAQNPQIRIIEFGDFQCRHCKPLADALDTVVETYPEQVQVVWKHMPNTSIHQYAEQASVAAQCAQQQGAFWEYHDRLFEQQSLISDSLFMTIAQELELDTNQFSECLESRDTLPVVQRDLQEGLALDLNATPTLFINNERLVGQISRQELLSKVRQILNQQNGE